MCCKCLSLLEGVAAIEVDGAGDAGKHLVKGEDCNVQQQDRRLVVRYHRLGDVLQRYETVIDQLVLNNFNIVIIIKHPKHPFIRYISAGKLKKQKRVNGNSIQALNSLT